MTTEPIKTPNEMIVELMDVDALVPYPGNAKKHELEQVNALASSIHKFGWTQPIMVDRDNVIIIGHGRRLAAKKLGLKSVPVVRRLDLSKSEADALRLADNRVTSTEYDMKTLQNELQRLMNDGETDLTEFFTEKELTTFSEDFGDLNLDSFVEDVGQAVEDQKDANEKKAIEIDASAAPLIDAMGFKRVTVEDSRTIRRFITGLEIKYGLKAAEAFVKHVGEHV